MRKSTYAHIGFGAVSKPTVEWKEYHIQDFVSAFTDGVDTGLACNDTGTLVCIYTPNAAMARKHIDCEKVRKICRY